MCARRWRPLESYTPAPVAALKKLRKEWSAHHVAAPKKLRKEWRHNMNEIAMSRRGSEVRVVGDVTQRWTFFTYRKVVARKFHEQGALLTRLKRDREAEM